MNNVVRLDTVDELFGREFTDGTKVIIKDAGDAWVKPGDVSNHIESIEIEGHGAFSTSADGKMLFRDTIQEQGTERQLIACLSDDEDVVIPDGVTEIWKKVFESNRVIRSVKFPESLRKIEHMAFWGCTNLEEVVFSEGLEDIGCLAFYKTGLKKVEFPVSLKNISYKAFTECRQLESVVFPEEGELEILQNAVFMECVNLSSVKFPEKLKEIGSHCFNSCSKLTEVHLPKTVDHLWSGCLSHVQNMYISSVPQGVISSVVNEVKEPPYTFSIIYGGCRFIVPRTIPSLHWDRTEKTIKNTKGKKESALFEFAASERYRLYAAYDTAKRFHSERAIKYLKKYGCQLLRYACTNDDEAELMDILNVLDEADVLSQEMLTETLSKATAKNWSEAKALVLRLMDKTGRSKTLFEL